MQEEKERFSQLNSQPSVPCRHSLTCIIKLYSSCLVCDIQFDSSRFLFFIQTYFFSHWKSVSSRFSLFSLTELLFLSAHLDIFRSFNFPFKFVVINDCYQEEMTMKMVRWVGKWEEKMKTKMMMTLETTWWNWVWKRKREASHDGEMTHRLDEEGKCERQIM